MALKIRNNIVSRAVASRVTYGGTNPRKYIVIHETANTSKGANADAHGRLQANGNSRSASWHYTVDDKEVVKSFKDTAQCWHAGNAKYNRESIGIEICVNSDGDSKNTVDNAVDVTKQLMSKYGISASNVIQHNSASGKHCPRYLRNGSKGVTWAQFKAKLSDNKTSNTNTSTSNKKPSNSAKSNDKGAKSSAKGDMKTNSIVVYLQSIGEPYSLAHRKKLASKYGINNYTGTAAQNTRLLSIIRGSTASSKSSNTKPSSKPKTSTTASIKRMADEVIAGKHGSGHVNRRKSLGVNQATYEKVRAEVNRRAGVKAAPKGKSVSQMASEVIAGKHGNGHANRRRSLGVNQATYNKVRAEVNRRS